MKMSDHEDGLDEILLCLEIVSALEILEYHNRNFLSNAMAQPGTCSREKTKMLQEAMSVARSKILTRKPIQGGDDD